MVDPVAASALGISVITSALTFWINRSDKSSEQVDAKIIETKKDFAKDIEHLLELLRIQKDTLEKDSIHAADLLRLQMENLSNTLNDLSDLLRGAIKTMNDNVATKQDHMRLQMRVDALEALSRATDREVIRLKDNCSVQGHKLRETGASER